MDWILAVSTLLANATLGWGKGAWWTWALQGANAIAWIGYAWRTEQYGFVALSCVTLLIDAVSGWHAWKRRPSQASSPATQVRHDTVSPQRAP